jgi:acyl-CoA hydrolase/RimJ/RimL family protein N-acetyltransferase
MNAIDWRARAVTAREAVGAVRPGERVFVGSACATPRRLVHALEDAGTPGVQLVHFLTDGAVPLSGGTPYSVFPHRAFYVGRDTRSLTADGKLDYVPISLAQVPRLIENRRLPIDVAFVQVAPPDAEGRCSLGVSIDIAPAALRQARCVIAEVNPRMPRTRGPFLRLEAIQALVEVDEPVIEYLHEPADAVAERMARYLARVIDDGSTLQIGLGRVPNEMLRYLEGRRDLGIHSDVITEPLVDLIEKGIVTGARKTLDPGLVVASWAMGTRRLYDLLDDSPGFAFRPVEEVCDPGVLARQEGMVSVTQAFAIDLTGQVCADQVDGLPYGGLSTQADFIRGAAAAPSGKPIVCLASTTDGGQASRIRATLAAGEPATLPRSDVHYVVTEYGVAHLFGKSLTERATALVEIAHPDFRESLLAEARGLGYLGKQVSVRSRAAYPAEEERALALRDGSAVLLRPTKASDAELIQELFYSLSAKDVYTRFFTNLRSLSASRAQHLCSVGYRDEMAFLAVVGERERETAVGSASYYLNPTTNLADVAYMVRPDWQGRGLGGALQRTIMDYARRQGVRGFSADVLCENEPMLKVFERSGCQVTRKVASGVYEVTLLFE